MKNGANIRLRIEPDGLNIDARKVSTILSAINKSGLKIRSECGGRQICGKCKVILLDPESGGELEESERFHLTESEIEAGYRLACACELLKDAVIKIPDESRLGAREVLVEGSEREVLINPYVRKFFVDIEKPSISDVRSDSRRILDFLMEVYGLEGIVIDYRLLGSLPEKLRSSEWKVTLTIWNNRIIDVERGKTDEKSYGISVDIGTSKIIVYLSDLTTGKLVGASFIENPQIIYGEDLISRVTYASKDSEKSEKMHKTLIEGINRTISDVCLKTGCEERDIYEVTVVGNTAMHHFFLSLPTRHLGLSPYVPVLSEPLDIRASDLSLRTNPSANVHVLPVIAGFVGADAVADIIATGVHKSDKLSMIVDIGTNTEVILGKSESMMACSCASGPAFEGAHIKCGMKAVTGAIESLTIDPSTLDIEIKTIKDSFPLGLCGSAVVDGIAGLLRAGIIDRSGRMTEPNSESRVRVVNGDREFLLLSKGEMGAKRDIVITQKDVREIQLAKAAIYTGCQTLIKKMEVQQGDIERFYIAGAFGNYINPENAKFIGMFPDIAEEKIKFVGNAAGAGARMALISREVRAESWDLAKKVKYLELALDPNFNVEFASATYLPHKDPSRFPSLKHLFL